VVSLGCMQAEGGSQWSIPYSVGPVRMEKDKCEAPAPVYRSREWKSGRELITFTSAMVPG
jgi:hypothetical protein